MRFYSKVAFSSFESLVANIKTQKKSPQYIVTSPSNANLTRAHKLYNDRKTRESEKRYVLVNEQLFDLNPCNKVLEKFFILNDEYKRRATSVNNFVSVCGVGTSDTVLRFVQDPQLLHSKFDQSIWAVVIMKLNDRMYNLSLTDIASKMKTYKKILLLDNVRFGENVGKIYSLAKFYGWDAVISMNSANALHPMVIENSQMASLKVPYYRADAKEWKMFMNSFRHDVQIWLADCTTQGGWKNKYGLKWRRDSNRQPLQKDLPIILILGSESNGIVSDLSLENYYQVAVKMRPNVKCLNVGMAAGLIMHRTKHFDGWE